MKCYLYILKNAKGAHYTGITSLAPASRLVRHNNGDVASTKPGKPWNIVYVEEFPDTAFARKKEKQIKGWHGGTTLKRFLDKTAGSSNGRTTDSESVNLGSNPGPAALDGNADKFGGVN